MGFFKVIFHPFRTSELINELSAANESLRHDSSLMADRLAETQNENTRMAEAVLSLEAQIGKANGAIRDLNDKLIQTRKERDQARFEVLHLDSVRNELARCVASRKELERRIEKLKEALEDSRSKYKELTQTSPARRIEEEEEETETEALQFPDFHPVTDAPPIPLPAPEKKKGSTTVHPGLEPPLPFDPDEDDWLHHLPKSML
ncbi:MAG: hypothetical protein HDS85_03670 [Bacteroidales bacterium]|nr:hypothetical protein [Bacteroidales bacterium]